jgi:hypothetical protein
MSVSFFVHVVNAVHHLMEVGPWNLFRKLSSVCYEVKQLSSSCILKYKCEAVGGKLFFGLEDCMLANTNELD